SVRQCMHKTLKEKGMLPKSDSEKLKFDQNCVVGITDELSPERFPILKEEFSEIYGIIGKKKPYTLWLIPIVGNRFAWSIGGRVLDSEAGKEDVRSFSFAEWWPEHSSDICDLVRDYTLPNFKVSNQDGQGLSSANMHCPHVEHNFNFTTSTIDTNSCHSVAPSEISPITSSCSSIYADNNTIRSSHTGRFTLRSIRSKLRVPSISGFSILGRKEKKLFPPSFNTSKASVATEIGQGFMSKHKALPAKPGTVAEIIDATRPNRISKVMLESKLFKVWHHERTVLIGDACHKVLPFAGQGAIQAILDCVSLANALYDMKNHSLSEINQAFNRYSTERMPIARAAVNGSRSFGKLINVKGVVSDFIRKVSFRSVPSWLLTLATDTLHLHRPQLTYLPMVPDRGSAKAHEQNYSPKYLEQLVRDSISVSRRQSNASAFQVEKPSERCRTPVERCRTPTERCRTPVERCGTPVERDEISIERDEIPRRERRHSRTHARFHPSMLTPLTPKETSPRSDTPPPLPLEAAPRHHPNVTVPLLTEEVMAQLPHRLNSPTGDVDSDARPSLQTSRLRRHTHNGRSRTRSSTVESFRSLTLDTHQPPVPPIPKPKMASLPISFNSHVIISSRSLESHNYNYSRDTPFNNFTSQTYTPPRSPLSTMPPVNFNDLNMTSITSPPSAPFATQYRRSHKRTNSLQLDQSLASSILALEQTTAMMKGRFNLREHRSLDQMKLKHQQTVKHRY
ncbi:hypothetical protein BGZ46_005929, partial [Entomortierella lignicola]